MNIRYPLVRAAVAAGLFLALSLSAWTVAAGAGETRFTLTDQSLETLRQEGLPNNILEKLETIKGQKFETEDEFLKAVRQAIGNDQAGRYIEPILQQAADDIGGEIERITAALAAQKRTIDALLEQNRALENRLAELEAVRKEQARKQAEVKSNNQKELEQRVKELEDAEIVREDATRAIIRDAMSTVGSKINESVSLGGTLEVIGGVEQDFSGQTDSLIKLNTAELDFEIAINEWTLGSLVIEYDDGTNVIFPTTSGFEAGVDRLNIDTAFIVVRRSATVPAFPHGRSHHPALRHLYRRPRGGCADHRRSPDHRGVRIEKHGHRIRSRVSDTRLGSNHATGYAPAGQAFGDQSPHQIN